MDKADKIDKRHKFCFAKLASVGIGTWMQCKKQINTYQNYLFWVQ